MKRIILASKQVGEVSYCVETLERLYLILESGYIYPSRKVELNVATNKKQRYISLSRNLTAACKRNPKRWYCGVILDGNQLSEHYKIEPFSYANTNLEEGTNLAVKSMTAYENGTYKLALVNWPTMDINKSVYDAIAELINSAPDEFNTKHKLVHTGRGSRKTNGTYIVEKYLYNVKHGGVKLSAENLGGASVHLAKHTVMNETEERIWIEHNLPIKNAIKGIVVSKADYKDEDDEMMQLIKEVLEETCPSGYKVVTY